MATTSPLSPTAELFRQIGYMADDERSIRRVLRYVTRVNRERDHAEKMVLPRRAFEDIKEGIAEVKASMNGGPRLSTWEEFEEELRHEGYIN